MNGVPTVDELQAVHQKEMEMKQADEQRAMIMDQILEPAAKDRLTRLALVKPDKSKAVQDSLIRAATTGQLKGRVTDAQLIAMLEQVSSNDVAGDSKTSKIIVKRKKYGIDDDSDDDNDEDFA